MGRAQLFRLVFAHYRALRRAGDLSGHKLILAPGLMHLPEALRQAVTGGPAVVVFGPRSGARGAEFSIPVPLPPDLPGLDCTIAHCESLRPDCPVELDGGGYVTGYFETIEGSAEPLLSTRRGAPVVVRAGPVIYNGAWLDAAGLDRLIARVCLIAGLRRRPMPEGIRLRRTGTEEFWFNYTTEPVDTDAGRIPAAGLVRHSHHQAQATPPMSGEV
jgi:beta-galactosidase